LFTREVLERLAALHERPVGFALSNPTSKAECTAAEAYEATGGRAIFASGSPFAPLEFAGRLYRPGQGNNAYIFPGVGSGAVVSGARRVTDEMFLVAADALAAQVWPEELAAGCVYPALSRVREVSVRIAAAVASAAWDRGLAERPRPECVEAEVRAEMHEPVYADYVGGS
jgi:malate dehydrogenase (oxaloacetate-decarboxylating)(NADP+)